jgi:hypothetical protein
VTSRAFASERNHRSLAAVNGWAQACFGPAWILSYWHRHCHADTRLLLTSLSSVFGAYSKLVIERKHSAQRTHDVHHLLHITWHLAANQASRRPTVANSLLLHNPPSRRQNRIHNPRHSIGNSGDQRSFTGEPQQCAYNRTPAPFRVWRTRSCWIGRPSSAHHNSERRYEACGFFVSQKNCL